MQPITQTNNAPASSSSLQHQPQPDIRSSTMQPLQPLLAPRPEQSESADVTQTTATPGPAEPITEQEVGEYREQDRYLPIANVSRIMKSSVPPTAKIAKDAKECVQECVSEFISFITSEAAEKCSLEKRKTIGGEDILQALGTLGFDNYAQTLKIHLAKLRQHQNGVTAEHKNAQRHEEDSPQ